MARNSINVKCQSSKQPFLDGNKSVICKSQPYPQHVLGRGIPAQWVQPNAAAIDDEA
jgi:hypothetical protein